MYETSSSKCKRLFEVSILQNYIFIIFVPVLEKIELNAKSMRIQTKLRRKVMSIYL
jgi:hypothetical protein